MDTVHQLPNFLICIGVGFFGGILYEVFSILAKAVGAKKPRRVILQGTIDVGFFLAFAMLAIASAYVFAFPDFRIYMWVGYLVGGIIYLKTLHKIIAFFENICYNGIKKIAKKAKNQEETPFTKEKGL